MTEQVPETSLLGSALRTHAACGALLPLYGRQLERLSRWELAGKDFDRLAETVQPSMRNEFANRLLSLVVVAAIDATMVGPPGGAPTIAGRRAVIESRYAQLFRAIDVLDRAFAMPAFEIVTFTSNVDYDVEPFSPEKKSQETSTVMPGAFSDDDLAMRSAVHAYEVVLGLADPKPDNIGDLRGVRYQTQDAPAALRLMRAFLLGKKVAELEALHMGTLSRRADGAPQVRTFVVLLNRRLRKAMEIKDVGFVTTMVNVLFGTDHVEGDPGNDEKVREFDKDSVRKILERAAKREAKL